LPFANNVGWTLLLPINVLINLPYFGRLGDAGWHHWRLVEDINGDLDKLAKGGQCLGEEGAAHHGVMVFGGESVIGVHN
jgi:hypothetical protein